MPARSGTSSRLAPPPETALIPKASKAAKKSPNSTRGSGYRRMLRGGSWFFRRAAKKVHPICWRDRRAVSRTSASLGGVEGCQLRQREVVILRGFSLALPK